MLDLQTKQSGGKLLPHSDLRGGGGVFPGEASRSRQRGARYKLDVVGVQEVRWDKGGTVG